MRGSGLRQSCRAKNRLRFWWFLLNFGHSFKELARCNDQRVSPLGREMFHIARDQVVCAGRLGALQKNIVVRIGTSAHFWGGLDLDSRLPDGPECTYDCVK